MEYIVGQRWVSQAESKLGLGMVVETDGRQITLLFPAAEEERIYAVDNAPLARIVYQPGDTVQDVNHTALTVKAIEYNRGLAYYLATDDKGDEIILPESKVSGAIQLSTPTQRVFSGQFDKNIAFELRAASLHFRHKLHSSKARGLLGCRTSLLPHQLYIAQQVAQRFAPRVLLADEVGLGKTIEAGMILHHQLQTGLASRALIIVPESLQHQWLVEMLRRFNLAFALFDQQRCEAIIEAGDDNPFETEQLILCSLDFLLANPQLAAQAEDSEWDMLIVDEAHHLQWQEGAPSDAYQQV
ncbi:DEAD/DEAH box helicase family protein, partial [bacterium]|nr:DEAD/DEAH box helicase family protein [bacterium]